VRSFRRGFGRSVPTANLSHRFEWPKPRALRSHRAISRKPVPSREPQYDRESGIGRDCGQPLLTEREYENPRFAIREGT
jgi:hypothetical protein